MLSSGCFRPRQLSQELNLDLQCPLLAQSRPWANQLRMTALGQSGSCGLPLPQGSPGTMWMVRHVGKSLVWADRSLSLVRASKRTCRLPIMRDYTRLLGDLAPHTREPRLLVARQSWGSIIVRQLEKSCAQHETAPCF